MLGQPSTAPTFHRTERPATSSTTVARVSDRANMIYVLVVASWRL
jgi:hypothetical protein